MKIFIIVTVILFSIIIIAFMTCVTTDRILVVKKLKQIKSGMTGYQVQDAAKVKLKFISVKGEYYYAQMISPRHFYKYNLVFRNGKLKEVGRI